MYVDDLIRSQFGKPSGLIGSLFMGPLLDAVNMRLMDASIELLDPRPQDVVMDVGFGGGHSLLALSRRVTQGKIVGVDYSPEMVERAKASIRQRRLAPRVRVECADVADLPFRSRTFDKLLAASTIYYWRDVMAGLRETARVLKAHGRIVVGFRSRSSLRPLTFGWSEFRLYEPEEFAELMRQAGFRVLSVEHRDRWRLADMVLVLGEKRPR